MVNDRWLHGCVPAFSAALTKKPPGLEKKPESLFVIAVGRIASVEIKTQTTFRVLSFLQCTVSNTLVRSEAKLANDRSAG